jgi:hypothetical protein
MAVNDYMTIATTQAGDTSRAKPAVVEDVVQIRPNLGPALAAYNKLVAAGRVEKKDQQSVRLQHQGRMAQSVKVTTSINSSTTTLTVDAARQIRKFTTLYCPRTKEQFLVTADPSSPTATSLTVITRPWGTGAAAAMVDGDRLVIGAPLAPENWTRGTGVTRGTDYHTDYIGTFLWNAYITWHESQNGKYGIGEEARILRQAREENMLALDRAMFTAQPKADTSGNVGTSAYMPGGLIYYGDTYNRWDLSGSLTVRTLDEILYNLTEEGGSIGSVTAYMPQRLYSEFAHARFGVSGMTQQSLNDSAFGLKPVTSITSTVEGAPGLKPFIVRLFNEDPVLQKSILLINWANCMPMQYGEKMTDVMPTSSEPTGAADRASGAIGWQMYTSWGFGVKNPLGFAALITGVNNVRY